jgi:hypothetical protein
MERYAVESFREADNLLAVVKFPGILFKWKVDYRVQKSPPLAFYSELCESSPYNKIQILNMHFNIWGWGTMPQTGMFPLRLHICIAGQWMFQLI